MTPRQFLVKVDQGAISTDWRPVSLLPGQGGALDAARLILGELLPAFEVIPVARHWGNSTDKDGRPNAWHRVEAINHGAQLGALVWVREIL